MFGAGKRLENVVENSFGKNPLEEFSFYNAKDRMDNVKRYHNLTAGSDTDNWQVDETTWNDLEMDEVFLRINHTNSFIGEQMLYHRLHMLTNGKNINQQKKLEDSIEIISNILEEKITLEDAIENQLLELENKKNSIQSSIDLCQKIVSDGKFTSDDTDYYLAYVKEEEEKGKVFGRLDDFLDEVTEFGEYLLQASSAEMFIFNQFRRNRALSFIVIIAILVCPAIAVVEDIFCGNGVRFGTMLFGVIWWGFLFYSFIEYRRSK